MRTKGWERFAATIETLIDGFKSGEIVVPEEGASESESAALQVVADGANRVAELLSTSELAGAELAVTASAVGLRIAEQAIQTLFPNNDVMVSLWTLMPNDSEWLDAHYIGGLPPVGIASECFGKMPLYGSPCGDAIRTGRVVYAQMPGSVPSIYREFADSMAWTVGSLVAWPLAASGALVAVLLLESTQPDLLVANASMNRVLDAIASLFERIFETTMSSDKKMSPDKKLPRNNTSRGVEANQHLPKD